MGSDLLLDTHTVLWMANEPEKLSDAARDAVLDSRNTRFLSIASVWEICLKVGLKKIRLDVEADEMDAGTFFKRVSDELLLLELPLRPYMIYETIRLPQLHGDPFDRMLVAQAKVEGMTLVTKDRFIRQYDVPTLW